MKNIKTKIIAVTGGLLLLILFESVITLGQAFIREAYDYPIVWIVQGLLVSLTIASALHLEERERLIEEKEIFTHRQAKNSPRRVVEEDIF